MATVPSTAEVIDRFRVALAARDIVPPESVIADGSIHRCDAAGKNGNGDAAYLLHLDGIPAGVFSDSLFSDSCSAIPLTVVGKSANIRSEMGRRE